MRGIKLLDRCIPIKSTTGRYYRFRRVRLKGLLQNLKVMIGTNLITVFATPTTIAALIVNQY